MRVWGGARYRRTTRGRYDDIFKHHVHVDAVHVYAHAGSRQPRQPGNTELRAVRRVGGPASAVRAASTARCGAVADATAGTGRSEHAGAAAGRESADAGVSAITGCIASGRRGRAWQCVSDGATRCVICFPTSDSDNQQLPTSRQRPKRLPYSRRHAGYHARRCGCNFIRPRRQWTRGREQRDGHQHRYRPGHQQERSS